MTQRYKVFINSIPVHICSSDSLPVHSDGTLTMLYSDLSSLSLLVQLIESSPSTVYSVWLHSTDPSQAWKDFQSLYLLVEAAGGCVYNSKHQLLLIYRNGFWDLPKGHIDAGESPENAAVREVEEECGTHSLSIIKPLSPTFHTYFLKDKRILKKTHWYRMSCPDQELVPQKEEGISAAVWADSAKINEALRNTYASVAEMISQ